MAQDSITSTNNARNISKKDKIECIVKQLFQIKAFYYPRSDVGAAQLFTDIFRQKHRYNVSAREWFRYYAGVWEMDSEGLSAKADLKLLGEALVTYAARLDIDEKERNSFALYACKWLKSGFRITLLNDAKDLNYFRRDDLDRDLFTLNCKNKIIHLKGDKVESCGHSPGFLLSKMMGTDFIRNATCPRWDQFLREVTQGDEGKQKYLQKMSGLALIGEVPEHKFFIIFGSSTRNGKTTFTETLLAVMGDYATSINPETLASQKIDSRRASGDLARLSGVRLAICSEAPRRMPLDSALLKKMTGGEKILARHLMEREFEFQPQFSLLMNTNYLPATTDSTVFSSGRITVCEFNRHFEESEQDKHLKEKLVAEAPGILNWMLRGYALYLSEGFEPPESIKRETRQYEEESDRIAVFLSECLEKSDDPETYISVKRAYPIYVEWAEDSGYQALGKQAFTSEIKTKRLYKECLYLKSTKEKVYRVIQGYQESGEWHTEGNFDTENPYRK